MAEEEIDVEEIEEPRDGLPRVQPGADALIAPESRASVSAASRR